MVNSSMSMFEMTHSVIVDWEYKDVFRVLLWYLFDSIVEVTKEDDMMKVIDKVNFFRCQFQVSHNLQVVVPSLLHTSATTFSNQSEIITITCLHLNNVSTTWKLNDQKVDINRITYSCLAARWQHTKQNDVSSNCIVIPTPPKRKGWVGFGFHRRHEFVTFVPKEVSNAGWFRIHMNCGGQVHKVASDEDDENDLPHPVQGQHCVLMAAGVRSLIRVLQCTQRHFRNKAGDHAVMFIMIRMKC